MSPLGTWASPCPTQVPWVVPPHQSDAARTAHWSSLSTAEFKNLPHLAKAAKVTRWHAAWPRICFTCETALHLNLAVNNLARMLEKKRKQLTTSPLPEIKYFTSPSHSCSGNRRWRSLSLSASGAAGNAALADSAHGINGAFQTLLGFGLSQSSLTLLPQTWAPRLAYSLICSLLARHCYLPTATLSPPSCLAPLHQSSPQSLSRPLHDQGRHREMLWAPQLPNVLGPCLLLWQIAGGSRKLCKLGHCTSVQLRVLPGCISPVHPG